MTWSKTAGAIDLGWGRCTLTADDNALVLHADAQDDADLQRLQALLSARLHQIGRRDHLTVSWQSTPTPPPATAAAAGRPQHSTRAGWRGSQRGTVALVAVGVLVVAVHLGLGAAAIVSAPWTGWALDLVLIVVVVMLLAPIVLGRRLLHRRKRSPTRPETSEQTRA